MAALSQAGCLALWELGNGLHRLDQGLLAIQSGSTEVDRETAADWPLGRRNRVLVELRTACFGPSLKGWTECEGCTDKLEFNVDASAFVAHDVPSADAQVEWQGRLFRLPTSRDLASIAGEKDASRAAVRLVERCMLSTGPAPVEAHSWTDEEVEAVGEKMASTDPLSELLLHFDCPACGRSFDRELDVMSFLWTEIKGRARRLLHDVHTLARAYGWSEPEILLLSPTRRAIYLEMVRA